MLKLMLLLVPEKLPEMFQETAPALTDTVPLKVMVRPEKLTEQLVKVTVLPATAEQASVVASRVARLKSVSRKPGTAAPPSAPAATRSAKAITERPLLASGAALNAVVSERLACALPAADC